MTSRPPRTGISCHFRHAHILLDQRLRYNPPTGQADQNIGLFTYLAPRQNGTSAERCVSPAALVTRSPSVTGVDSARCAR